MKSFIVLFLALIVSHASPANEKSFQVIANDLAVLEAYTNQTVQKLAKTPVMSEQGKQSYKNLQQYLFDSGKCKVCYDGADYSWGCVVKLKCLNWR